MWNCGCFFSILGIAFLFLKRKNTINKNEFSDFNDLSSSSVEFLSRTQERTHETQVNFDVTNINDPNIDNWL